METPQDGRKDVTFAEKWLEDARKNDELDQELVKLVEGATANGELDTDQLLEALQALDEDPR